MKNEIILFEDQEFKMEVNVKNDTVWLNSNQIAELFERDIKTIRKHINNALAEELFGEAVVAKFATTASSSFNSSFNALLICLLIVLTSLPNNCAI